MTLACVVLHNLCIERGDVMLRHWDMSLDPEQNEGRPTKLGRDMLYVTNSPKIPHSNKQAANTRDALKMKFNKEKQDI